MFLREVQQEFDENDLDGVLVSLIGKEITYAPDGRIEVDLEHELVDITRASVKRSPGRLRRDWQF